MLPDSCMIGSRMCRGIGRSRLLGRRYTTRWGYRNCLGLLVPHVMLFSVNLFVLSQILRSLEGLGARLERSKVVS